MGHRPIAPVKIGYENTYLYLTICPFTGEGFATFLPKLDSTSSGGSFKKWKKALGKGHFLLLMAQKRIKKNFLTKTSWYLKNYHLLARN
jgi:hypothetical protein